MAFYDGEHGFNPDEQNQQFADQIDSLTQDFIDGKEVTFDQVTELINHLSINGWQGLENSNHQVINPHDLVAQIESFRANLAAAFPNLASLRDPSASEKIEQVAAKSGITRTSGLRSLITALGARELDKRESSPDQIVEDYLTWFDQNLLQMRRGGLEGGYYDQLYRELNFFSEKRDWQGIPMSTGEVVPSKEFLECMQELREYSKNLPDSDYDGTENALAIGKLDQFAKSHGVTNTWGARDLIIKTILWDEYADGRSRVFKKENGI